MKMPDPSIVGGCIGEDLTQVFSIRFGSHQDFHITDSFIFQVNLSNVPNRAGFGFGYPRGSINDLAKNCLFPRLFLDFFFRFFPTRLSRRGERLGKKIQN
jgi:hypothetical protein